MGKEISIEKIERGRRRGERKGNLSGLNGAVDVGRINGELAGYFNNIERFDFLQGEVFRLKTKGGRGKGGKEGGRRQREWKSSIIHRRKKRECVLGSWESRVAWGIQCG